MPSPIMRPPPHSRSEIQVGTETSSICHLPSKRNAKVNDIEVPIVYKHCIVLCLLRIADQPTRVAYLESFAVPHTRMFNKYLVSPPAMPALHSNIARRFD